MARVTTVNLVKSARFCSARSGIASLMRLDRLASVAQKEEQQIERQEQVDDDVGRATSDVERLRGEIFAGLHQRGGQPLMHRAEIGQPEAAEEIGGPCGQRVEELLKERAEVQFP